MADCCRCGRRRNKAGSWPDGYVCRTCVDRALRIRGNCPGCDQQRALPGRRPSDGAPICTTCADFSQSFACARCGYEGKLHGGRRCTRCALADRLDELLDDGTGRIHPRLAPLAAQLLGMDNPLSGLTWLSERRRTAAALLRGLADGEIPLTHTAFRTLQPWRAAAHLRELLMACELLPAVDKQILLFERWLHEHLTGITDPDHAQILRRFATWHVLPRLRGRAETRPISPVGRRYAGEQILQATALLAWLAGCGRQFADCTQSDIDTWFVEQANSNRVNIRAFLQWSAKTRLTRCFELPTPQGSGTAPMPERDRTALLGKVLTGEDAPLRSRAAAAILLLYANRSAGSPDSPSTTSSATATKSYCGSATHHHRFPSPSARCCSSTSAGAPTWPPPRTAHHAGCSPDAAPDSHSVPTPCPRWSTNSASQPQPAAPPRSASTSSTCQPRSSPPRSAITTTPPPASLPRPAPPGPTTPPRYHRE